MEVDKGMGIVNGAEIIHFLKLAPTWIGMMD